jgi:hypothetical protein
MSAVGQKAKFRADQRTSALAPEADIWFVPGRGDDAKLRNVNDFAQPSDGGARGAGGDRPTMATLRRWRPYAIELQVLWRARQSAGTARRPRVNIFANVRSSLNYVPFGTQRRCAEMGEKQVLWTANA